MSQKLIRKMLEKIPYEPTTKWGEKILKYLDKQANYKENSPTIVEDWGIDTLLEAEIEIMGNKYDTDKYDDPERSEAYARKILKQGLAKLASKLQVEVKLLLEADMDLDTIIMNLSLLVQPDGLERFISDIKTDQIIASDALDIGMIDIETLEDKVQSKQKMLMEPSKEEMDFEMESLRQTMEKTQIVDTLQSTLDAQGVQLDAQAIMESLPPLPKLKTETEKYKAVQTLLQKIPFEENIEWVQKAVAYMNDENLFDEPIELKKHMDAKSLFTGMKKRIKEKYGMEGILLDFALIKDPTYQQFKAAYNARVAKMREEAIAKPEEMVIDKSYKALKANLADMGGGQYDMGQEARMSSIVERRLKLLSEEAKSKAEADLWDDKQEQAVAEAKYDRTLTDAKKKPLTLNAQIYLYKRMEDEYVYLFDARNNEALDYKRSYEWVNKLLNNYATLIQLFRKKYGLIMKQESLNKVNFYKTAEDVGTSFFILETKQEKIDAEIRRQRESEEYKAQRELEKIRAIEENDAREEQLLEVAMSITDPKKQAEYFDTISDLNFLTKYESKDIRGIYNITGHQKRLLMGINDVLRENIKADVKRLKTAMAYGTDPAVLAQMKAIEEQYQLELAQSLPEEIAQNELEIARLNEVVNESLKSRYKAEDIKSQMITSAYATPSSGKIRAKPKMPKK
jgi:hypothetical protein